MVGKIFTDVRMPESLQILLPDAPPDLWYGEDTFDEDGLLHSYDDKPITVKATLASGSEVISTSTSEKQYSSHEESVFRWYSHGKISRLNNLPPYIIITPEAYSTFNENGQLQSYNDMPSRIRVNTHARELDLKWHVSGLLHRDNLLPTSITYGLDDSSRSESFFLKGISHRGNSLPSEVGVGTQIWTVQGVLHNTEGYAESYLDFFDDLSVFVWSLYGVQMPEKFFDSIKQLATNSNIPLYIAFLVSMRIISLEQLNAFVDVEGGLKTDIPVAWVLRALNVTPEIFTDRIKGAKAWNPTLGFAWHVGPSKARFKSFMSIIASDAADAAAKNTFSLGDEQ